MKKTLTVLILLTFTPSLLLAVPPEQERRIEEEKREDLRATEVHRPRKKPTPPPMDHLDTIYFTELSFKKVIYRYDLCKTVVILKGVELEYLDLNSQVAYLKKEKLLPEKFQDEFDPMQPLRKGLTAYVILKSLNIKGGLFLHIFKKSRRLALNELVYQGIMSAGNTNDLVSGEELTSIIKRAADYRAKHAQTQQ